MTGMQQPDEQLQEFHAALDEFEASVETPFVPGEMEHWIEAVASAWERLLPLVKSVLTNRHPQLYAEIQREDQGLLRRIEQMRQQDAELEAAIIEVGQRIPTLKSSISHIEPDEAKLTPMLETFVNDALNLVISIRKQEQAVRTWFLEALERDRGTVD